MQWQTIALAMRWPMEQLECTRTTHATGGSRWVVCVLLLLLLSVAETKDASCWNLITESLTPEEACQQGCLPLIRTTST